jgi:Zn-dependent protease with chaperone function
MEDSATTQKRLRFEQLVRQAELHIQENPSGYKARLAALALLGYIVLFGVLAVLIALIAGSLWAGFASTVFLVLLLKKKLIVPLAAMAWIIARALWVRVEPPRGYVATHRDFPVLHAELSRLRRRVAAPSVHEVILSDEFNAGVVQTPRLGVFGWPRNTVMLGLPLLLSLAPDQARAVLAHEFGHLSRNHSRFNGWVYRLRLSWYQVMAAFDQTHGWSTRAMRRFFDWYAPYFSAYSFALARGNEYEADAVSVQLTSVQAAAQALVSTHVRSEIIHDAYWKPLLKRADREPTPESKPYTGLAQYLKSADVPHEDWHERMRKAVAIETGHADTHPALRDRLQAMKAAPTLPAGGEQSAAEAWLGSGLSRVLEEFDRQWLEHNREPWQERYQYVQDARARLAELSARPRGQLSKDERWNLAAWTEELEREADPLPLYREYQANHPDDRDADFTIGRILLERRDAEGLVHLERAMQQFQLVLPACELAYRYFRSIGDQDQADYWRRRGEAAMDTVDKARAERATISAFDTYIDAHLNPLEHEELRKQFAAFEKVKHAWIARKQLQYAVDTPLYVIAVEADTVMWGADKLTTEIVAKVRAPGSAYFIALKGEHDAIAQQVKKVGTQIV